MKQRAIHPETLRILYLEANPDDLRLFEEYLRDTPRLRGSDVVWCVTLKQGLEMLNQSRFDLVVTSTALPDAWFMDIVESILSLHPDQCLIVLSEGDDDVFEEACINRGAQDVIDKSFCNEHVLERSVRKALVRHQIRLGLLDYICSAEMAVA